MLQFCITFRKMEKLKRENYNSEGGTYGNK